MAKPVDIATKLKEGEALRALIDAKIKDGIFKNDADFAKQSEAPGGKSMLSFVLRAKRPIPPDGAKLYAKTLGCPVSAFSPRVAELIGETEEQERDKQAATGFTPKHSRKLVQRLCVIAESISNDGLLYLIGKAEEIARTYPLEGKAKRAS